MSCQNHGRLNISTCHCHCPPGYTGRYCQGEGTGTWVCPALLSQQVLGLLHFLSLKGVRGADRVLPESAHCIALAICQTLSCGGDSQ